MAKKTIKKKAPAKKPVKKVVKKTIKPSKALKKAVKTRVIKVTADEGDKVDISLTAPVVAEKKGPAQVKPSGKAALKGGAVVFEAEKDADDAPKGKSVVIRGGKAVVVEDSENPE
jgi:hypothetical protein